MAYRLARAVEGDAGDRLSQQHLARPGGNLTGVNLMGGELIPNCSKCCWSWSPGAKLIALLRSDPTSPVDLQKAARAKGVRFHVLEAVTTSEIDAAFATLVDNPAD
jgi:hypothetical protein